MKFITYTLFFFTIVFTSTSCSKEEGCTDPSATNYNPEAEKNDGSCVYSDPGGGTFQLNFNAFVSGGQPLVINQPYADSAGYTLQIEDLKFYISNLTLVKNNNQEVIIKDVDLIDLKAAGENYTSALVPLGDYKEIKFGIGVDSLLNDTDPTTYNVGHPLSTFQNTYWPWVAQYRFIMLEGRADTINGSSSNLNQLLSYHTGAKSLYREYSKSINFSIQLDATHEESLSINLNKIFYGSAGDVDLINETSTHSYSPLALKITENFKLAIE